MFCFVGQSWNRVLVAPIALAMSSAGCATYRHIASYPNPTQPVAAVVVTRSLGLNDRPIGAWQDDERRIVVSGHQKATEVGAAFGLIGIVAAHQIDKSAAITRFGDAIARSEVDLVAITRQMVGDEIAAQRAPQWTLGEKGRLQLSPHAVFTVLESGKARLHALLRAEIPSTVVCPAPPAACDDEPLWSVRYFVRVPGEHSIEGVDGWMQGARYNDGIRIALQRAVQTCIDDTRGKFNGASKAKANGAFPFLREEVELPVILAHESQDSAVARLLVDDGLVLSGTQVLDLDDFDLTDEDGKSSR